jgi:hypothetical protein
MSSLQNKIESSLRSFLTRAPLQESTLTLDGTGVNGALQYTVLSGLGADRLQKLKRVNVLSASTYAYLCFLAHAEGLLAWDEARDGAWDKLNRRAHDIVPLVSALRLGFALAAKRKATLDGAGFVEALRRTVAPAFFERRVEDLPANVCFWLYEHEGKRLVPVTPSGPHAGLTLAELIRAAPAVPGVFAKAAVAGKTYSDPVYCRLARDMYRQIRAEAGANHLMSNMRRDGAKDGTLYLKPHAFGSGDAMILMDLASFLLGAPNPRIGRAIRDGLLDARRLTV